MRPDTIRTIRIMAALLLLIPLLHGGTCDAAPPASVDRLARTTSLTAQDRAAIEAYADYYVSALLAPAAEGTDEDLRRIRSKLVDPLRVPGVTLVFRDAYGRALEPRLEDRLRDAAPHQAVNAVIVLSKVGTERALGDLVDLASTREESRAHVRLAAARGCADVLRNAPLTSVNPNKITSSARALRDAVRDESEPHTLRHLLDALLAADRPTLPAQARGQIRGYLVEALDAIATRATRIGGGQDDVDPSGLLEATRPVLHDLRNSYLNPLNLDTNAQRGFGQKLGPCIGRLLESANENWTVMQATPDAKEKLRRFIFLCEGFLTMIDATVRTPPPPPPNTKLSEAWAAGDADRYRSDLAQWRDVLKNY